MRYLIVSLLFLTISCKNNPADSDTFEPYTIGTWLVETPDKARWIGQQPMQKITDLHTTQGDTIVHEIPDGQEVWLQRNTGSNADTNNLRLSVLDSTITASSGIDWGRTSITFEDSSVYNFRASAFSGELSDDYVFVTLWANWNCKDDLGASDIMQINFFDTTGSHFKSIRFLILPGFQQAAEAVGC